MVARSDSMFGNCYDSYSYRLWSLANVWNTCQLPPTLNSNNGSLIKEEELTSNLDYLIKCSQCQKGCTSFLALKEHMESVHHAETSSMENGLIGSALSPNSLNTTTGGSYHCPQCTSSFSTKDQLDKHELLHSPNAQVVSSCKICNKTFANVYRLQRHMISHDESALLRKFKCNECEKAFKFKHHLKEHIRIHSGEKPFECGNCGKRFSHSGSYSSHMTSKKCLVMNLKLGRTRAPNLLEKNSRASSLLKRDSPMNNNGSPEHSSYLPILPKYSEAAAAFLQSSLLQTSANSSMTPFYLTPPPYNQPHSYNLPTLSQILDQIQQRVVSPLRTTSFTENNPATDQDQKEKDEIDVESSNEDLQKSDTSCCGDLIMDEDRTEKDEDDDVEEEDVESNRDLEAVKRILETVNASVTKEFLQANMQKFSDSSNTPSECHSPKGNTDCTGCNETTSECEFQQREGLAIKLEEAVTTTTTNNNNNTKLEETQHSDETFDVIKKEEEYCESVTTTDHVSEDGRKVRVRSLISESQLKILKDNYAINPRPKREDLEKIASSIGFPVRVVQVWFQNTRARDRREGRLVQVPYSPTMSSQSKFLLPSPRSNSPKNENYYDEPLDLSTKKSSNTSTPSSSPSRPTSVNPQSEFCDEVVNLSSNRKSPSSRRSPVPYVPYTTNHLSSNSSPSNNNNEQQLNNSRLAQILAQPAHKLNLPGMGLVPMEQLMQFGVANLTQLINNNQNGSPSPNSEKRWNDDVDDDPTAHLTKRLKMSQYMLKSLGSPLLGNQDGEAEGQFVCDQCDKAFSKQSSLARHKYEHSGQRPHKCDECPKAFKHKHHLTEHKRLHSGEKPFQCTKCLKRFSHSGSYSQHMNHRSSYCKPYRE